jgi:hypothetical protein
MNWYWRGWRYRVHVWWDRWGWMKGRGWGIIVLSVLLLSHGVVRGWILSRGRRGTGIVRSLGVSEDARGAIAASRIIPARNESGYFGRRKVSVCTVLTK